MAQMLGICAETHRGVWGPHTLALREFSFRSTCRRGGGRGRGSSLSQGSALLSLSKVGSLTASLPLEASGFPQVLSFHTLQRGLILFFYFIHGRRICACCVIYVEARGQLS